MLMWFVVHRGQCVDHVNMLLLYSLCFCWLHVWVVQLSDTKILNYSITAQWFSYVHHHFSIQMTPGVGTCYFDHSKSVEDVKKSFDII